MHPVTFISFGLSIAALALHLVPVSEHEPPSGPQKSQRRLVPKPEFLRAQSRFPRVRRAFARQQDRLKSTFQHQGAFWPPRDLLLRAYKHEGELELYAAAEGPIAGPILVGTFPICAASGVLGPKRFEGDLQVPEGQYFIDRFNPSSRFHLSLGINYPNAVDRARSGDRNPGGDIFIHGGCATVGCLPIGDEGIEILYVAAALAKAYGQPQIPVQILPCRFQEPHCADALSQHSRDDAFLEAFWRRLRHQIHSGDIPAPI